jgi:cobalt-zinc-cadmium efflux system outer membrane protein
MRKSVVLSALAVWCLAASTGAQTPALPAENPSGPITLRDAVALALAQSPDLAAFDWGRRAAEARQLQARRRPNPIAGVTLEDLAGTNRAADPDGVVQPQATIQLSQVIELGGKRAARQQLAQREQDLAGWDYETARLDLLSRVASAFYAVLAGQDGVTHATSGLALAQDVHRTVAERVAAGVVSPIEETRADVLVASARIELDRATRTLDARRRQLTLHWGHTIAVFEKAVGDLASLPAMPTLTALDAALTSAPDLVRWNSEIERRQAALAVARSLRVPDLTVSAGYRRFTSVGSQAAVIGVAIPVPWFDRNKDGIRAADAEIARASAEAGAARLHLQSRLADAYRALVSAGDDVEALRTRIVPGAQSVFDAVREGYQLGRFGLMEVLDAQRTLTAAKRDYLEALVALHHASVGVERLVGRPLSEVVR